MQRWLWSLGLLVLLTGCGGNNAASPVLTPTSMEQEAALDPGSRENAALVASEIASLDITADATLAPMVSADLQLPPSRLANDIFGPEQGWAGCRSVEGNARDGMTITYNNCLTPRGRINGTIIWTNRGQVRSAERNLMLTRSSDGRTIHLRGTSTWSRTVNQGHHVTRRTSAFTVVAGQRRLEVDSRLQWEKPRGELFNPYPFGQIELDFYLGGVLVRYVSMEFDGTNMAEVTVDGVVYLYPLNERNSRPRLKDLI